MDTWLKPRPVGAILLVALAGACASVEIASDHMRAAECMRDVVKAAPTVEAVRIETRQYFGRANPVLDVSYREKSGLRGRTWLEVERSSGSGYFVMYPFREPDGAPLTDDVIKTLETQCNVYVDVVVVT